MVAASQIFDEAHDETVFFLDVEYDRRNFFLAEGDERLQAPLAAHEIITPLCLSAG